MKKERSNGMEEYKTYGFVERMAEGMPTSWLWVILVVGFLIFFAPWLMRVATTNIIAYRELARAIKLLKMPTV